jgi:hypothetical protein
MQFVDQHAKKLFKVAVRSDGSGHADERFVPHRKGRGCYNFRVILHDPAAYLGTLVVPAG